jgi:hypothetical protein
MPRFCIGCGRPLDETGHDRGRYPEGHPMEGEPIKRVVLTSKGRGRFGVRYDKVWECRVRLVGVSPTSGRRLVPSNPQRDRRTGMAAYVHVDRLAKESHDSH